MAEELTTYFFFMSGPFWGCLNLQTREPNCDQGPVVLCTAVYGVAGLGGLTMQV